MQVRVDPLPRHNRVNLVKLKYIYLFCFSTMILEVYLEVFPSVIFQTYMVFVLQQDGLVNYISILSSITQLLIGSMGVVTYLKHGQFVPMKKSFYCLLSAFIDIIFRIIFISFFSSLYSPYAIPAIVFIYVVSFYLSLYLQNSNKPLSRFEFLSCFYTLPTSSYEDRRIKYSLRPKSKLIFNTIALIGLVLITGPVWKSNPTFEKKHLPITNLQSTSFFDHCKNICHRNEINVCSSFSLSEQIFYIVLISLWILLIISTLEGLFEQCFEFMPHKMFCEEIEEEIECGIRKKEEQPKLGDERDEGDEFLAHLENI